MEEIPNNKLHSSGQSVCWNQQSVRALPLPCAPLTLSGNVALVVAEWELRVVFPATHPGGWLCGCAFIGLGQMGGKRQKTDGFSPVNTAKISLSFCLGTIFSFPPVFCRPWKQWVDVFQTLPSSLGQQAAVVGRGWQGHPPAGVT